MKQLNEATKRILTIVLIVVFTAGGLFIGTKIGNKEAQTDGKTAKLTFEDIGELATQSAYCTEIEMIADGQKAFGFDVPFTQAKQIYSYDVEIKAGYDFTKITYDVDEEKKLITVKLPQVQTLSKDLDTSCFKVYHEQDSMFTTIKLEKQNKALQELIDRAEKDAIENGLYEEAEKNAELVLKGFFASEYNAKEYKLQFETE